MIDVNTQFELRKRFNPDGSQLRMHQERMLEILKFIDDVCSRHGINYWLSSGTLIGAVRHGGFIPWDDDVDIEMLKEDFVKFDKVMKEESNDSFGWQTRQTDKAYLAPYAKVRDLNSYIKETNDNDLDYKYHGFYVDVFILEPSNSLFLCKLSNLFFYKLIQMYPSRFKGRTKSLTIQIGYNLCYKLFFPIISLWSKVGTNIQLRHISGSGFEGVRHKSDIFPLKRMIFEDSYFPVPNDCDSILKGIYGNYMSIPNLDGIHPHVSEIKFQK